MAKQDSAFEFRPTKRQWEALQALRIPFTDDDWKNVQNEREPVDVLFGGGRGGGKSVFLCAATYIYAIEVAKHFHLPKTNDPVHVAWMGRKVGAVFVGTTLSTWKDIIPSSCYTLKPATSRYPTHICIDNRVAIDYSGLDNRSDLERFNSAELGMIALDQAEETSKDDVAALLGARRKRVRNYRTGELESLPYRGLFSANPRQCWLIDEFIRASKPGKTFIPALHKDNEHLPANYLQTLEDAFGHRPDLLAAYRDGCWDALGAVDQVVLREWITAAAARRQGPPFIKRLVTCDPARFGDDECVILGLENTRMVDAVTLPWSPEERIVSACETMATKMGNCPIVVEETGYPGVVDTLRAHGRNTFAYRPADASTDPERYVNLRAQIHSEVGKMLATGCFDTDRVAIFTFPRPQDPVLATVYDKVADQMTWSTYEFRGQRVMISPKDKIKAAHNGKSPDYADAYIQGVWHLRYVEPQVIGDKPVIYSDYEDMAPLSPMAF